MLRKVKLVVVVAAIAEDLLRLDDPGGQAVAMHYAGWAGARLDELRGYSQLRQVFLPLDGISSQDFQELGEGGLRQSLDVIIASEDRSLTLA